MDVLPLGRVLGLVLDRHESREAGSAVLVSDGDGGPERVGLSWHSASVWRCELRGGGTVCDGTQVQEWQGAVRSPPHPARPGWPDWNLQLVFPLRAHVWGRMGDDYFPAGTRAHPEGVQVDLLGMEGARTGHLVVDPDSGFVREMSLLGGRRVLRLEELTQGPLPDRGARFVVQP